MQSPETLAVILQDLRGYFLSRLTFYRKKAATRLTRGFPYKENHSLKQAAVFFPGFPVQFRLLHRLNFFTAALQYTLQSQVYYITSHL